MTGEREGSWQVNEKETFVDTAHIFCITKLLSKAAHHVNTVRLLAFYTVLHLNIFMFLLLLLMTATAW